MNDMNEAYDVQMMSTDETSNEPHVCLEGTVSMDVKTMSTLCTCLVLVLVCQPFEAMCIGSITSHIEGTVIMWVCSSLVAGLHPVYVSHDKLLGRAQPDWSGSALPLFRPD